MCLYYYFGEDANIKYTKTILITHMTMRFEFNFTALEPKKIIM